MIRQPENLPERVKEVRRQLALAHEELAYTLGVIFATVNRWENGKIVPSKLAQCSGSSNSFVSRRRNRESYSEGYRWRLTDLNSLHLVSGADEILWRNLNMGHQRSLWD